MGISHGKLPEESNESASRLAYRQQIVYGPGYQFGFDYLHDQMKLRQQRKSRLGKDIISRIRGG
jgi:preprotein translocase subunit SecA